MNRFYQYFSLFLDASRTTKRLISLIFDTVALLACFYFALSASTSAVVVFDQKFIASSLVVLVGSIVVFIKMGFYRAILRYMGLQAVFLVTGGILFSSVLFAASCFTAQIPFTALTLFCYWSFSLVTVGGARLFVIAMVRSGNAKTRKNVIIYGAGQSARQLAKALAQGLEYKIVAYIDDDPALFLAEIDGVKIYSPISIRSIVEKYNVSQVLLAMPSVSHARRAEILNRLEPYPLKVKTLAPLEEIVSGKVQIEQLEEIELEDLLGRDSVEPDFDKLHASITDKVVMVTGAGGSIGSELCRQIVSLNPKAVILYELSEFALYSIEKELNQICESNGYKTPIISLLGSVQHKNRMIRSMRRYHVQTVYHAAAYKHVPIVEHNIVEGIRNNVFGTWYAAEAASEANVERFVLVSTDKAVRPTNVMGASKRLAEMVLQAINNRGSNTVFTMVRFGNVLGSSGSVVPLFREQIKSGGPITVTHKDIIRYFMTIPEAAQLVIQAGAMGKGGDVFVLDMGDQVKISELAERMVHLMGLSVKSSKNPQGDIEIRYSGLRPGEKLYEELLIGENVVGTTHPKIMTAQEELLPWIEMSNALAELDENCDKMDCEKIIELLLKIPTGYNPQHEVCDLLWEEEKIEDNIVQLQKSS